MCAFLALLNLLKNAERNIAPFETTEVSNCELVWIFVMHVCIKS